MQIVLFTHNYMDRARLAEYVGERHENWKKREGVYFGNISVLTCGLDKKLVRYNWACEVVDNN